MSASGICMKNERNLLRPCYRSSREYLDQILSDKFIEIGSTGKVYDKVSAMNSVLNAPNIDTKIFEITAKQVSETYTIVRYKTCSPYIHSNFVLRHSLWTNISGNWQLLYHEATQNNNDPKSD